MNLSPESVKKTLLNKVNELSASSWQYTKKPTDFTRELLSGAEHTGNRSRDNNTYVISKETEIGMLVETYQKLDTNAQKRLIGYMEALKELS